MIETFFKVENEKKSRNLLTMIEKFFKVETEIKIKKSVDND